MGWFSRKPKGRERVIRADYRSRPRNEWTEDEEAHFMATCTPREYWASWETWSRETYDHPRVKKVRRSVLDLALAAGRESLPHEFGAMLRLEGDTISELVLLPIVQGDAHTIMYTNQLPVDRTIKGTLHSHPDRHPYPSDADFAFFEKQGVIHLILCKPFGPGDWRAYDHTGLPIHLDVVEDSDAFATGPAGDAPPSGPAS